MTRLILVMDAPRNLGEEPMLVVGGVTLDTLHLGGGGSHERPGGAGLYTALGCRAAGGAVALFAQVPDPMPAILDPFTQLFDWRGPVIPLSTLPRLEIAHYGSGRAELLAADWGAQLDLEPADLPPDLSRIRCAHVAALGPTGKQIAFARACRRLGVKTISAGTYGRAVSGGAGAVRQLIDLADRFFMNENEALGLFGSLDAVVARPGQVLFVTQGARGAWAITSRERAFAPALEVREVDPTGAGDTLCGAVNEGMEKGLGVEEALRLGVRLAAVTVGAIGPDAWL